MNIQFLKNLSPIIIIIQKSKSREIIKKGARDLGSLTHVVPVSAVGRGGLPVLSLLLLHYTIPVYNYYPHHLLAIPVANYIIRNNSELKKLFNFELNLR